MASKEKAKSIVVIRKMWHQADVVEVGETIEVKTSFANYLVGIGKCAHVGSDDAKRAKRKARDAGRQVRSDPDPGDKSRK